MKYALVLATGLVAVPSAVGAATDVINCTPDGGSQPVPTNAAPIVVCPWLSSAVLEVHGRDAGVVPVEVAGPGETLLLPELPASSTVAITTFGPSEFRFVLRVGAGPDTTPPSAPDAPHLREITNELHAQATLRPITQNIVQWDVTGLDSDVIAVELMQHGTVRRDAVLPGASGQVAFRTTGRECLTAVAIDRAGLRSPQSKEACIDVQGIISDPPAMQIAGEDGGCRCVSSRPRWTACAALWVLAFWGVARSRGRAGGNPIHEGGWS